jgi:hypothetical protein
MSSDFAIDNSPPLFNVTAMNTLSIPSPDDVEGAAKELHWSIAKLCREADIDASVYHRWRGGFSITTASLRKMLDAIEREKAKKNER